MAFEGIRDKISEAIIKRRLTDQVDDITRGGRLVAGSATVEVRDGVAYTVVVEEPDSGPAPYTITVKRAGSRLISRPIGGPLTKSHRDTILANAVLDAIDRDDRC